MKTDLYYHPSGPWTQIFIDDNPVNPNDVYGFLYPVRRYLMQAWLYPSGSWLGLRAQMEELARGEDMEVIFHGREIDFRDFEECLRGMAGVTVAFEPWQGEGAKKQIAGAIRGLLSEPVVVEREESRETVRPWGELFPRQAEELRAFLAQEQPWLVTIRDDRDFRQAQRQHGCCLVTDEYLTSYERLFTLRTLTRSMRRAEDMIVCRLDSPSALQEYRDYAQNSLGLRMRFVSSQDDTWEEALRDKYGVPLMEQQSASLCDQCLQILNACLEQKNDLNSRLKELRRQADDDTEEIRRLEGLQAGLRVLSHRLPGITDQMKLIVSNSQEVIA